MNIQLRKILSFFRKLIKKDAYSYEDPLFTYLKKILPSNPNILECGSHDGYDTAKLANFWPEGKIFAFEANPDVYKILSKVARYNPNIFTYPMAISDKTGKSTFVISGGKTNASSSLMEPKEYLFHPEIEFTHSIQVDCITIKEWAIANKINKLDFLWLDMQGAEPLALMGLDQLFENVSAIFSEINFKENYKGNWLYPELKEYLKTKGFEVIYTDIHYEDSGNALFVRKDIINIHSFKII